MSERNPFGRVLGVLGLSAAAALGAAAGCAPLADDINTVQPGYVKKEIFQTGDEWYYRRTIVDSETTNSFAIEGAGDIYLDRIKFRVEEKWLVAYKPYEAIPGAEEGEYEGLQEFEGPVLAAWPILYHFDIIRGYDTATGRKTNIVEENTTDRPWYEREFFRVNWSANTVEGSMFAGWSPYEFVYYPFEDDIGTPYDGANIWHWTDLETAPTDPYASRFTKDYVELTNHVVMGMDLWNCASMVGFTYDAFIRCGYGEAQIRSSFVRIKEKSDYIPRDYPDSVVKKDADGTVTYDEETGEAVREPVFERFGFFRIETPTYDRGYGMLETGRLFRATLHNLWERHTDDLGNELPYAARTPRPIIYYLNADYPARWRAAAAEVADDYNRIFSNMVADLTGKPASSLPRMFEIRDNDCNIDNVKKFVSQNSDFEYAVTRAVCTNGVACDDPMSLIGIGNLESVCTSLEAATRDPDTGLPQFDWQRVGDARFKMVVWLENPQESGWGGYGPMHSDARTGETVSATAFIRGGAYEIGASRVVDYIELMNSNDPTSVADTIYGQNIRRQVQQTIDRSNIKKTAEVGQGLISRIKQRTMELGRNKNERLIEVSPNEQINRLKRIQGTSIEEVFQTPIDLAMAAGGRWQPGKGQPVSEDMLYKATPVGRLTEMDALAPKRDRMRKKLGEAGFCFLNVDVDPHYAGLALDLKDLPREEMYRIVAHRLIRHVLAHEVGHNVGLSHNFEGSYDALNYYDEFWNLHWAGDQEKVEGGYDEHRNTTVMEYMSMKGLFSDRLGKYDEAALRFAYANQVQVFDQVEQQGGQAMKTWRLLHDYKSIPDHLCGGTCGSPEEAREKITSRSWVSFDPQNPPANEVPYMFCDNVYSRRTPFCATFDYGSNLREIHANYYNMWAGYFFFNNFIRDRLVPISWSPWGAMQVTIYAMWNINVVNQYFQHFQALDPNFVEDTELGRDMLATLAEGLNMAAEIVSVPEPMRMCPWPQSNPPVYIPYYYFNGADCNEHAPLDSQYAIDAQQIQIPLGVGRPASLGFTDDFVDYDIAFVGSYFDKLFTLERLGLYGPTLFRFNYDLDVRSYQMGLYRLFDREILSLLDRLVVFDPYFINQATARDLGSYWCRNPEFPDQPQMGYMVPRQMLDLENGQSWPEGVPNCESPSVVYPTLLTNMPFQAMVYAHALYSSDFDSQYDIGKAMKIFVLGADDEPTEYRNLPADQICSCIDRQTAFDYRAVRAPEGMPDLGCRLVERACDAQADWEGDMANDYYKDRWRSWMERLEFARDLSKIFNP